MSLSGAKAAKSSDTALSVAMALFRTAELEPRFKEHFGLKRIRLLEHIIKSAIASRPFNFSFNNFLIHTINRLPYSIQRGFISTFFIKYYDLSITSRKTMIQAQMDEAIKNGVTQIVNLGGGYDCGLVISAEANPQVNFFELDMDGPTRDVKIAALQSFKYNQQTNPFNVKCISDKTYCSSNNLFFVACNLITDDLEKILENVGFDSRRKTLFIGEGLTMYLPSTCVDKLFSTLKGLMQDESEILISMGSMKRSFFHNIFLKSSNELCLFTKPLNDAIGYVSTFGLSIKQKYSLASVKKLDVNNSVADDNVENTREPYYVIVKSDPQYNFQKFRDIPEIPSKMMQLNGKSQQVSVATEFTTTTTATPTSTPLLTLRQHQKPSPSLTSLDVDSTSAINDKKSRCGCVMQ